MYVACTTPNLTFARRSGDWHVFTGDQLGALFAGYIVEQYKARSGDLSKVAMVASTVSSKMLEAMAREEGFKFVECLTGGFPRLLCIDLPVRTISNHMEQGSSILVTPVSTWSPLAMRFHLDMKKRLDLCLAMRSGIRTALQRPCRLWPLFHL